MDERDCDDNSGNDDGKLCAHTHTLSILTTTNLTTKTDYKISWKSVAGCLRMCLKCNVRECMAGTIASVANIYSSVELLLLQTKKQTFTFNANMQQQIAVIHSKLFDCIKVFKNSLMESSCSIICVKFILKKIHFSLCVLFYLPAAGVNQLLCI